MSKPSPTAPKTPTAANAASGRLGALLANLSARSPAGLSLSSPHGSSRAKLAEQGKSSVHSAAASLTSLHVDDVVRGVDSVLLSSTSVTDDAKTTMHPSVVGPRVVYCGYDRESMCQAIVTGGTKWCFLRSVPSIPTSLLSASILLMASISEVHVVGDLLQVLNQFLLLHMHGWIQVWYWSYW